MRQDPCQIRFSQDNISPLVEVKGAWRTYHRGDETIHALRDVSIAIPRTAFVTLVGPSGGGKSTLLHLLGGIDRPTAGTVSVNGWELERVSESDLTCYRRKNIGFVFQFYNLLPFISSQENVALPLLAQKWRRRDAMAEAARTLERLGLGHRIRHKPTELSGGEQQRVAIARAVVTRPCLLLADEPTGDLDEVSAAEVMALLREVNHQSETTCIVATHNIDLIAATDRIIHLSHGKIMQDGTNPQPIPMVERTGEQIILAGERGVVG